MTRRQVFVHINIHTASTYIFIYLLLWLPQKIPYRVYSGGYFLVREKISCLLLLCNVQYFMYYMPPGLIEFAQRVYIHVCQYFFYYSCEYDGSSISLPLQLVRLSINNEVAFEPLDDVRLMLYIHHRAQTNWGANPRGCIHRHGTIQQLAQKKRGETLQGVTRLQTSPRTSLLFVFHFVPSLNREREKNGEMCVYNSSQR